MFTSRKLLRAKWLGHANPSVPVLSPHGGTGIASQAAWGDFSVSRLVSLKNTQRSSHVEEVSVER